MWKTDGSSYIDGLLLTGPRTYTSDMSANVEIRGELSTGDIAELLALGRANGKFVLSIVARSVGRVEIVTGTTLDRDSGHGSEMLASKIGGQWIVDAVVPWRTFS